MKINVTQQLIDQGERATPFNCPLATAATQQLGVMCCVGETELWIGPSNTERFPPSRKTPLPQKTQLAIYFYDLGFGMVPGEYEVNL